jgi:hypothetical protein
LVILGGVMKNIFRKVSLPAVLVLVLVVGFAGLAYAAIPDSQGAIHGCYRTTGLLANGQMRIIDSDSQTCNSNEAEITWNQTGPQGPGGNTEIAYAHITYDGTVTWDLDSSRTQNFSDIVAVPDPNPDAGGAIYALCLTSSINPKSISTTLEGYSNIPVAAIKDDNGWTNPNGQKCDEVVGANVYIPPVTGSPGSKGFVQVF